MLDINYLRQTNEYIANGKNNKIQILQFIKIYVTISK